MQGYKRFYLLFISLVFLTSNCIAQKSKLVRIKLQSQSLENSIYKVESQKEIVIYLPPSYHTSEKLYPVIYYLPGFTSPIKEFLQGYYAGFKLQDDLDELIQNQTIKEMIVVFCDGENFLGGGFYANSPLIGNYEDFIVKDIVGFMDSNYRTIPNPKSRAISGNSMGGFGAFSIGMKHSDIFAHNYIMSPGAFDESGLNDMKLFSEFKHLAAFKAIFMEINQEPDENQRINLFRKKLDILYDGDRDSYFSAFAIAYGATFCSDTSLRFPYIRFPNTPTSDNNLKLETFDCWRNGFGNLSKKIKQQKNQLLGLESLVLDCGLQDGWITNGTLFLSNQLVKEEIPVEMFWYNGGHTDKLHLRLKEHLFPYLSSKLTFQ